MANFIICLEIKERSRDYEHLRQLLKKMAAAQILETVWLTSVAGRADQLRDALRATIHPGDSIIVMRLKTMGASTGLLIKIPLKVCGGSKNITDRFHSAA